VELIAELATGHGGDVSLAEEMIAAAADAGAHTVKIQSYSLARLNPRDPQAAWLKESYLDRAAHERLIKCCEQHRVGFLSTPFDYESFVMLRDELKQYRYKVASTGRVFSTIRSVHLAYIKSWPWGRKDEILEANVTANLTAIPLYPTPLEAVGAATLLDGWSDHTVGIETCQHMISQGAKIIEAHFYLPNRSRHMPWDKSPEQLRQIRDYWETVETMRSGISRTFRERWCA
jgi:N,N'-diacetyllegionaminate synthase